MVMVMVMIKKMTIRRLSSIGEPTNLILVSAEKVVDAAILVYDDNTESISKGTLAGMDKISVIANYQALLIAANQQLRLRNDEPSFMTMEIGDYVVFVHRLPCSSTTTRERSRPLSSLITIGNKSNKQSIYKSIIRYYKLLDKVFTLLSKFSK
eukprot:TRINITY_DN5099_c0_g1_i3.p1 TRINITY_DN5099_c0_g1~~TRINITY_DN5099_c0_g1_i3.p1  ORF type:complete len:153 (+),score=23.64 TRINITY_DN5099_c0_g1_i3:504-962(+)